jgi:outer membrane immunogenic protein
MKRFRIGILAVTLTSVAALASANAADLFAGGPGGYKDGPSYPLWTGFYVGGHFGAAGADDKIADLDNLNGGARYTLHGNSITGGGQFGYNWQGALGYSPLVLGVEGDIGGINLNSRRFDPNFPGGTFNGLESGLYGDITGRAGLALGQALAYGKAGFAFYNGDAFVDNHLGGFGGGRAFTPDTFTGWTAGGGLELSITPAWSIKGEFLHFDFGSQNATLHTPFSGTFRYSNDLTVDTATVGINYHFGAGYMPLK